ncbi:prolyl oligopeptidase family serine peptidase [Algicola sagamiensis]|uniref:prolyl oligopeptidase family serine peptidase n=1 Tax=Algicola sagamiensis TaxID=163869 RepID=UPI0003625945|nr:prolyl oligopeptidase family serine peptidase [Algicola sagamiensis]
MNRIIIAGLLALVSHSALAAQLKYPETKTIQQVDNYHGTYVSDPYRWLEDDVRVSKDVAAWVNAQNKVTRQYLEQIPAKGQIADHLKKLWNYEKRSVIFQKGDKFFFYKNDGLQNQYVLYVQDSIDGKPRVLIDPNSWSKEGTAALGGISVHPDGKYIAYAIQESGSDWRTWKIRDVATGKDLEDELQWLKFTSVKWFNDDLIYARYPRTQKGQEFQSLNQDMKVYRHRLGQKQAQDQVIYFDPKQPNASYDTSIADDKKHIVITSRLGTDSREEVVVLNLADPSSKPNKIVSGFDYEYSVFDSKDSFLYVKTTENAPKGKVLLIDLKKPEKKYWKTLIPEQATVLRQVEKLQDFFVTSALEDAKSKLTLFKLDGTKIKDINLPGIGTISSISPLKDSNDFFYSYTSFNRPSSVYRYDAASGNSNIHFEPKLAFNPDQITVKQVFYKSKDGTRVPMFIMHKKGLKLTGNTPTLLYGYGGFNISILPSFSPSRIAWIDMGGVYAVANIRGGGEYGEAWHKAGTKLKKQNVFDDFISAAKYLIEEKYTSSKKLAVEGGSNGGLLVGAVTTQRPDLFGAAIPHVGVMDMLRFQKFTAGRFWVDDFGSSDNPTDFANLYRYSPYHNVRPGVDYPATLVMTADTDDRVVPSHSFKYIAALQKAHGGQDPVLIRIESSAGHGAGTPTSKRINSAADIWAFLAKNFGMKVNL